MVKKKQLRPVFTVAELAEVLDWPTQRTRRALMRLGVIEASTGRRALITYADLIERAPSVYYALLAVGAVEVADEAGAC